MSTHRRGGWGNQVVTDQEIRDLLGAGVLGASAIARALTSQGKKITPQAISLRLKVLREEDESRANYILPWVVKAPEHTYGWAYTAARAYAKREQGKGLTQVELRRAKELEEILREKDAVLTYDHKRGFLLRDRRPDDGPSGLAVS